MERTKKLPKRQVESKGPEDVGKNRIQGSSSSHGREGSEASTSVSILIGIAIEMIMNIMNSPREYDVQARTPAMFFIE